MNAPIVSLPHGTHLRVGMALARHERHGTYSQAVLLAVAALEELARAEHGRANSWVTATQVAPLLGRARSTIRAWLVSLARDGRLDRSEDGAGFRLPRELIREAGK